MLDNQVFITDDFQISYQDAIATIELLFDDKIKELMGADGISAGYLDALKQLKREFADDFQMTLDEVIRTKKSK